MFKNISVEYDANVLPPRIQTSDEDKYVYEYSADTNNDLVSFVVQKHFEYGLIKSEEELGCISDITIENVNIFAKQNPTFKFWGQNPKSCVKNITLKNIYWNGEKLFENYFLKHCEKNENVSDVKYKE